MTKEEFSLIIDKTCHLTKYYYMHIMGEPLLHPDLEDMLKIANDKAVFINITTNATLLKQNLDVILKHKPRKISISLHSLEENKAFSTGYIENCLALAKVLAENKIITEFRLWNNDHSEKNQEIIRQIENCFEIAVRESMKLSDCLYLSLGESFDWPCINREVISENGYCLGLKEQIGILVDGTVVPCCLDSEGYHNFGNIFTENIDEILNKKEPHLMLEGFRNRKFVSNLCKRCGYATKNFGGKNGY